MGSLLGSWCGGTGARAPGAWWCRPAVVRALNARVREHPCACGAPSSEAEPARGRSGPSREAEPARGKRTPSNGAEPGPREACALERGGAYSRGSLSGPPWWAVGATAAWAMPRVLKWGAFGFDLFVGFKWGFPSLFKGTPRAVPDTKILTQSAGWPQGKVCSCILHVANHASVSLCSTLLKKIFWQMHG
jgi:hypothetical protein